MAMRFENAKDLEEMRQMKKEAREAILEKVCKTIYWCVCVVTVTINLVGFFQAKRDYEKRKAKADLAKLRGEDKWMLPELEVSHCFEQRL